jgi:TatD DNase family protein
MVSRGYVFTIGVEVKHTELIRTLAREVPLSQLLTETDGPGGLEWLTGEIGMPRHIIDVVQSIAELKQAAPEIIRQSIRKNFMRLIAHDLKLPDEIRELMGKER